MQKLLLVCYQKIAPQAKSGKYFQIWFFPPFRGKKWRRSEHAHASYPGLFFRTPGFSPYMGREERRVQGLDYCRYGPPYRLQISVFLWFTKNTQGLLGDAPHTINKHTTTLWQNGSTLNSSLCSIFEFANEIHWKSQTVTLFWFRTTCLPCL